MTIADTPAAESAAPLEPLPLETAPLPLEENRKPYLRLLLLSFFLLFFELACIRWFGSTVVFLTFFTNIVLIATFLGMSVGLMTATRKINFITWTLPIIGVAAALSAGLLWLFNTHPELLKITVGNQIAPAQIYFGTEYHAQDISKVAIPMPVIAGVFFTLIALAFVGLGQEMGRAFDAIPNRLMAYTVDIIGSLFGISLFACFSFAWTSPLVWFSLAAVMMIYFVGRYWSGWQSVALVVLLAVTGFTSYSDELGGSLIWSPYYKVAFRPTHHLGINTNNIAHQNMEDMTANNQLYPLVHALNRDAGQVPFENVMIIGAGSGNDVAAAMMSGVYRVDAVEIDRAIQSIGSDHHPNRPYDNVFVKCRFTDGRQWLKRNAANPNNRYDLAVYALVDSLVLHSGYSSLRLESFLFTKEAFGDVKANMKDGGVFAMYNYYRQGWVVGRLVETARETFGTEPLVFSFTDPHEGPQKETISANDSQANSITFCLVGMPDVPGGKTNARIEAMRAKLKVSGTYWLASRDHVARLVNGYSATPPVVPAATQPSDTVAATGVIFKEAHPAIVNTDNIGPLPTDDWPQLYLREPKLPKEVWTSMIVIGSLSLVILLAFSPKKALVPSGRMFFLGAGFMLLETKGVVHMSLLFGATWITNSVVFFAILVMVLLANLFVLKMKPAKLWPFYLLLFATLAINALVPMSKFLELDGYARPIVSCAVIFIPVFFAGVIFGSSFEGSTRPDADLGWNIAGIIVGALAENFSVVIGFKSLIVVAIGFYLLSMPFVRRRVPAVVPGV